MTRSSMTALVIAKGFRPCEQQEPGTSMWILNVGVFRIRVRLPLEEYPTFLPAMWVGWTAGGPLVERRSDYRSKDSNDMVHEAVLLARTMSGH